MKIKKIAALILVLAVVFTSLSVFANTEYATRGQVADMLLNASDFYNPDVVRSDILKGYEDGLLHEDWNVTRAEALVMLSRAFEKFPPLTGHNARTALSAEDFYDIPSWAQNELDRVFDSGLVAGVSKGVFSPNSYVTVSQMELFISRVYSLYGANPKDDFYASVNKKSLDTMKIDKGNVVAGTFSDLQKESYKNVESIISAAMVGNFDKGTPQQKIADFYSTVIDVKTRNKQKTEPVDKYIKLIENADNIGELTLAHNTLSEELCVQPFIGFSLTTDIEDSNRYMLYLDVMTPYMNKEVYSGETQEKDAYLEYLTTLLSLSGEDEENAKKNAQKFFEFESELAFHMLDIEKSGTITKSKNVISYNKVCSMFPDFDMEKVLEGCALKKSDEILVADTALTQRLAQLYNQSNLDVLKTAAKISVLLSWGNTLNEEFYEAETKLSNIVLGTTGSYLPEQIAVQVLENTMPEYLGALYVERYFDKESKLDVQKIAYDIIDTYKSRINNLTWMGEDTKEKANRKLETMQVKIGYPDTFESYIDTVEIVPPKAGGTYFKNMLAIKKAAVKHYGNMQYMEKDRNGWLLYPYTVNACYEVSTNDITIPAAILQAPLYNKNASYEENLGGIGYIIAHEITHAFDSVGGQYDENGNLNNWWTEEDRNAFNLLCEKTVEFFDGYEAISGIPTDGELTLNENIADIGAVACVTQLAGMEESPDYKTLYTSMAKAWAETRTREYAIYTMKTDFHSDPKARINKVLVNFEEFYEAFDITEGDGMYVSPEERIKIW